MSEPTTEELIEYVQDKMYCKGYYDDALCKRLQEQQEEINRLKEINKINVENIMVGRNHRIFLQKTLERVADKVEEIRQIRGEDDYSVNEECLALSALIDKETKDGY